jgi:hypothetical protein
MSVERVAVAFGGDGAGEDVLSWGQRDVWVAIKGFGSSMAVGGSVPLRAGTTIEDVASEACYLMSRYQVLRTRLRITEDGSPRQVVSGAGRIDLDVVDTCGADPRMVAAATGERLKAAPFDHTQDWPVRVAVVRHGAALTHKVFVVSHFAVDGFSFEVMARELARRRTSPVRGLQPLEQARWQSSPAGRRQNAAAQRHWESALTSMPLPWPTGSSDRSSPRHWEGYFQSPAMLLAAQSIAARTCGSVSTILMTALAVAVVRTGGVNPVAVRPVSNNRFRPDLAQVVGPVSQAGLCLMDVAGISFEEAVARTHKASIAAHWYSYYDTDEKDDLVERIRAERGSEYYVDCFFNDRRVLTRDYLPDPPPDARRILGAVPERELRWTGSKDTRSSRFFVQVEDVAETALLNLFVDTHYLSRADAEALMIEMETAAVEAAVDVKAPTGV